MPAATAARKRKETDDMEVSPPKRVTRARSAKTQAAPDPAAKPNRATKTTTATTAKTTGRAASTKSSTAPKRATRSKASEEPAQQELEELAQPKTRGRPKKTTTKEEAADLIAAPKTRTRTTKATTTKPKAVSSTRARAPQVVDDESEDELTGFDDRAPRSQKEEDGKAQKTQPKSTRSRAATKNTTKTIKVTAPSTKAAASSRATGATAATTAKTSSTKKKVGFAEDQQDKENVPVRATAAGKPKAAEKTSTTGVRGRPARKATTASSSKASSSNQPEPIADKSAPLSPKKVDQVAKGQSSSSEDELAAESPSRPLNRSPIKPPQSARKDPGANSSAISPSKAANDASQDTLLGRSPMKPPQSARKGLPFSSASIPSPSKADSNSQDQLNGRNLAFSSSLLASPAKRAPISPAKYAAASSSGSQAQSQSHLLASPAKRVHLNVPNLSQSTAQQDSSLKQSLLQSPPRRPRPAVNPPRAAAQDEKKASFAFGDDSSNTQEIQAFNFSAATPRRLFPRQSEAAKSTTEVTRDAIESDSASTEIKEEDVIMEDAIADMDFDDTILESPSNDKTGPATSHDVDGTDEELHSLSTTPPGLPLDMVIGQPSTMKTNRSLFRDVHRDDSDDDVSMNSSFRTSGNSVATPIAGSKVTAQQTSLGSNLRPGSQQDIPDLGLTPLAHQFSDWLAGSAPSASQSQSPSASSLAGTAQGKTNIQSSPAKPSYFEDEMIARDSVDADQTSSPNMALLGEVSGFDIEDLPEADENDEESEDHITMSIDPQLMDATVPMGFDFTAPISVTDEDIRTTADPLELNMTPTQSIRPIPREVMTVSKVPLKPADEGSPIKTFRKKSKSLAPADFGDSEAPVTSIQKLSVGSNDGDDTMTDDQTINSLSFSPGPVPSQTATPTRLLGSRDSILATPAADDNLLSIATPFRTPRVGADAQILRGAVVFVDVHTTEGAEASNLFVEVLNQMGARCVKQWSWNPRNSSIGASGETSGGSKVGITHVVYKDGGRRTLEKVREARGLVSCVGVGWVLDCERENKWLDESDYAVDTSSIPRGGHNRRKSMEPKALSNVNGTLKQSERSSTRSVSTPVAMSPTKEFLTFSNVGTPTGSDIHTFDAATPTINFGAGTLILPETPAILKNQDWDFDAQNGVPATPYFMSKGAELVQATCPPKQQTGRMLFPVSGKIEDEPDQDIRRRLALARRKSLQWAPKIGSPLRRE